MRNLFVIAICATIVACAATGSQPSGLAKSQLAPTGTLKIGVAFAPNPSPAFVVLDGSKQPHGVPLDIGAQIAKASGMPYSVRLAQNSGELTDLLAGGEIDIAFLPVDEARKRRVDFGPDYFIFESTYLVRPGFAGREISDVDKPGVRIVGIANTATIRAATSSLKANTITPVPTVQEAVEVMRSGKADAFAFSRDGLAPIAASIPGSFILNGAYLRSGVAVAIPKGRPQALSYIDQFMEEAKSSGLVKRAFSNAGLADLEVSPRAAK